MNKIILSLFLIAPFCANASNHIDLTTSKTRDLRVSLGEEFTVTIIPDSQPDPFDSESSFSIPWRLGPYAPFELLHEGWNKSCIDVMAANTQIWVFKATLLGTHEIEFFQHFPSPLEAVHLDTISVEVY